MSPGTIRNPMNPNDYVVYEEIGFEWKWVGLFKSFVPIRRPIKFLTELFITDNKKIGIKLKYDGEQFYGTLNWWE